MIELKNISKTYEKNLVLDKLSLSIQKGDIFGIIGKSGAGKSTLLRCINGLELPEEGEIIVEQCALSKLKPAALRQIRHKIGMIFQHFNLLLSKTVFENIALPLRIQKMPEAQIQAKVNALLDLVALQEKKYAYPTQLSGGQKQRVAIARALSSDPSILLCDEATSALDPETSSSILDLLKKINQDYAITIVFITHQMEVVKRICTHVALLEKGQIKENILLKQLFQQKNSLAKKILHQQLVPALPAYLSAKMDQIPNEKPILRLFFQGENTTFSFISQSSRLLQLDINILAGNIDQWADTPFGVLIVTFIANMEGVKAFIARCHDFHIEVEVLGYVREHIN